MLLEAELIPRWALGRSQWLYLEQDGATWAVCQELQPYATCKRRTLTEPVSYQVRKSLAHQVYVYPKGELQVQPGFPDLTGRDSGFSLTWAQ